MKPSEHLGGHSEGTAIKTFLQEVAFPYPSVTGQRVSAIVTEETPH